MATFETVAIVSPKNPREQWRINVHDYDKAIHTLWEDRLEAEPVPVPELVPQDVPVQAQGQTRGRR